MLDTILQHLPQNFSFPKLIVSLAAAIRYKNKHEISFEEATDILFRELDLGEPTFYSDKNTSVRELIRILEKNQNDLDDPERILSTISNYWKLDLNQKRATYPREWLTESLALLTIYDQPILFINSGNSNLILEYLVTYKKIYNHSIDIFVLEHDKETLDILRLMLSLIEDNLDKIRSSVCSLTEDFFQEKNNQIDQVIDNKFDTYLSDFGTIYVDLFSDINLNPKTRIQLTKNLPMFLSENLFGEGRIILNGPSAMLNSQIWAEFRDNLRLFFHVESITDFSFTNQSISNGITTDTSIITLRNHQQAVTKQVTIFSPSQFTGFEKNSTNPLKDIIDIIQILDEDDKSIGNTRFHEVLDSRRDYIFAITSSELVSRWDPKYYCPARIALQNHLINNTNVNWLDSIAELIVNGTPEKFFSPYVISKIVNPSYGVKLAGEFPLMLGATGAKVYIKRFQGKVCVVRPSGALIGELPDEISIDYFPDEDDLANGYPAIIHDFYELSESSRPQITIRFVPPEKNKNFIDVRIFQSKDIKNLTLIGDGEIVLVNKLDLDKITPIHAGDLILDYGKNIRACIVPWKADGSYCHQNLVIIRPIPSILDPYYLLSYIISIDYQNQLSYIEKSDQNSKLDINDLKETLINLPPIEDQRRIAYSFMESRGTFHETYRQIKKKKFDLENILSQEYDIIINSLLGDLTSDLNSIHSLTDWVNLKGKQVQYLLSVFYWEHQSDSNPQIQSAIEALAKANVIIEKALQEPQLNQILAGDIMVALDIVRTEIQPINQTQIRERLFDLVDFLSKLLRKEESTMPKLSIEFMVENNRVQAGKWSTINCNIAINNQQKIDAITINPSISDEIGELKIDKDECLFYDIPFGYSTFPFSIRVYIQKPGFYVLHFGEEIYLDDSQLYGFSTNILEAFTEGLSTFEPIHPNPYITGLPVETPEMFFGRQDILQYLKSNLIGAYQSNLIILQGNRRTGKTSILKQISNLDLFAPFVSVYIDCQGLGALSDHLLFYKIAQRIAKTIAKKSKEPNSFSITKEDISLNDPFYDFVEFLDKLKENIPGVRVILLIDEFEVIDDAINRNLLSPQILENLRHLFQHRQDLAVVLTGSYKLRRLTNQYWSALFGIGLTCDVGFLDESSARKLVMEPLSEKVVFSNAAIDRIIEFTACQPYFIQTLCHNLVNLINLKMSPYVSQSMVEEAAQETLTSADGHFHSMFDSAGSALRKAILVYLSNSLSTNAYDKNSSISENEILNFLEDNNLLIEWHKFDEIVRELIDRDLLLIRDDRKGRSFAFKIDLVRQWIRRNYDLQSAIKLAQSTPYIREE